MANSFFQFKQFTIWQDKCAMKVGTDGVLLGAWTQVGEAKTVLDIGTGTGLIALMLAQRCDARILALEIDKDAAIQANENVAKSLWKERIKITCEDFLSHQSRYKYDVIVSNPPYFSNSLKSPDSQRNLARHTNGLTLKELIGKSAELLNTNGHISLIIPADCEDEVKEIVNTNHLQISKILEVCTRSDLPPKRLLIEIKFTSPKCIREKIILELERHVYSNDYICLTKEYYLNL